METALYHVLLEGRSVGPYDRRTIVGMRAKDTLAGDSVLIDAAGHRFTVEDLMRSGRDDFHPGLSGTFSIVLARFDAQVTECDRHGPLPRYEGGVELRVQPDVLRIAGRLRGRDDRVKIPLGDVVHVRARDSLADLWIRCDGKDLQAATFQMASPDAARQLVKSLPDSTPPTPAVVASASVPLPFGIVMGVAGAVLAIVAVVLVFALKR